jgi:hypothetical protein
VGRHERVDHDDLGAGLRERPGEIRPDEPETAGDEAAAPGERRRERLIEGPVWIHEGDAEGWNMKSL